VPIDGQDTRCLGLLNEHTTLEARVPVGSGSRAIVQVVVGNRTSPVAQEHFIRYSPPRIFSCFRSGKPGDCFVVSGQNFGVGSSGVTVRIGGVACSGVSVLVPHTRLEATVPEGQGTNLPVAVIIGGQESVAEKDCEFSYKGEHFHFHRSGESHLDRCTKPCSGQAVALLWHLKVALLV
jgi:hypothetical protein